MLLLAADEDFNFDVVRGVRRRNPNVDILRVQDAGLSGADDAQILEWAALSGRVLLTHDVKTMIRYAYDRVLLGKSMPGVFEVPRHVPIVIVIEEVILIAECSLPSEWEGQVRFLPLQ